jgi:amino acid permease
MYKTTQSYIRAIAALAGTTIGAGIFGIPYVMAQAGVMTGIFWILVVGVLLIATNLIHGEFSLRMRDDKKFVGIACYYFADKWCRLIGYFTQINFFGTLIAYHIIGGTFLHIILSSFFEIDVTTTTFLYAIGVGAVLYAKAAFIEKFDFPLVVMLFVTIGALIISGISKVSFGTFAFADFSQSILPYGVALFALNSVSSIPAIEQILDGNKKKLKPTIIWGAVISIVITLAFGVVVSGITGAQTTQDALTGLIPWYGNGVIVFGALIGLLAILTSHIIIGHHLKEIFIFDYRLPKLLAWAFTLGVPYAIVLFTAISFIGVLGFVGGVFGGLNGVLVGVLGLRMRKYVTREPEYTLKYATFWSYAIIIAFSIGTVYQLVTSIV